MTDTARARLEAEAEELYPWDARTDPLVAHAGQRAHVRAKTMSAEQVEGITAGRLLKRGYNSRYSLPTHAFKYEEAETIAGLRAAGFYVEGDEDV